MIAANNQPEEQPNARGEDGLTPRESNRLLGEVLRFYRKRRCPTNKDGWKKAVEMTEKIMGSTDPKAVNGAVKNYIAMERLNQSDQHKAADISTKQSTDSAASVTNQQINIYLPSNGRDISEQSNANGRH